MDKTQLEFVAIGQAITPATESTIRELNELQLALVGGGYGDTVI
jgi:hypothetical protein